MTSRERVAQLLGRPFPPVDAAPVDHLYALSPATLEEARSLGDPDLAATYLAGLLTPRCARYLRDFVPDVVFGDTPPDRWRRGRVHVLAPGFEAMLTRGRPELLAPIGGTCDRRLPVDRARWEELLHVGNPVRVDEDADYAFNSRMVGPGAIMYSMRPTEPVTDAPVAIRRWIAGTLSRFALAKGASLTSETARIFEPPLQRWSADAKAAWRGLFREEQVLGPASAPDVPGFRGNDAWYQD